MKDMVKRISLGPVYWSRQLQLASESMLQWIDFCDATKHSPLTQPEAQAHRYAVRAAHCARILVTLEEQIQ